MFKKVVLILGLVGIVAAGADKFESCPDLKCKTENWCCSRTDRICIPSWTEGFTLTNKNDGAVI
jgi:hypothetical protein